MRHSTNNQTSRKNCPTAYVGKREETTPMKQLAVIVKPHIVPKLAAKLATLPIGNTLVREVKGYGRQKSYLGEYLGSEYSAAYLPKVLLQVTVEAEEAETVIAQIIETVRTGRMGDGKIFVLDPESELL